MTKEIHEIIKSIGDIYGQLYLINENLKSLYQSPLQKYLPSIISIIAVGGSFGIAYYTSKWSYANQLKLEKIKREADKRENNKKILGDVYSRIELITSYIREVNIDYINIIMYGNLLVRNDLHEAIKKSAEKLVFESRNKYDTSYSNYIKYKSELANIIGQIHYDNSDSSFITELNKINNQYIFFSVDESRFINKKVEEMNDERGKINNELNTFINQEIILKYQKFLLSIKDKLI